MREHFKIRTTYIDYCVEEEDVCETVCEDASIEEDSEEFYDAIHAEIERVKSELPQELELEIDCEPEDLDDAVADTISEKTGWPVNRVSYYEPIGEFIETKGETLSPFDYME